jgi:hypothetical protein
MHGVASMMKREGWLRPLRGVNAVAAGACKFYDQIIYILSQLQCQHMHYTSVYMKNQNICSLVVQLDMAMHYRMVIFLISNLHNHYIYSQDLLDVLQLLSMMR